MTQEDILRRAILNDEFPNSEEFFKSDSMAQMVPDRLKFERNAALGAWMSRVSGREVNASAADWQANKDALVRGYFKDSAASNVSDEQLHSLVKTHIQTAEEAADMAANMAPQGKNSCEALQGLNTKRGPSLVRPIWDRYTKDLVQRHSVLSQKLAPYRGIVDAASSKLSKEMESTLPTTQAFQDVATQLLQVPEEDRHLVISAIGATGGATAEERASYLSKLAGAMGRMTETMGAAIASDVESASLAETVVSLQEAGQMDFARKMEKNIQGRQELNLLTQQIRQVADSEISPIKGDNWWSQTGIDVARMAPQIAVTVANPAIGAAANLSYFRATVAAEAKQEDPSLTYQQADTIGALTAPFNAAIETVTALIPFGKVKLPFVQKWLSTTTTSVKGAARNLVVRGAFGVASEVGEEMAQAVAPLWTQGLLSELSKDMPAVDWEKRMPDFGKIAAQTWGPALVFGLVGGGAASINDIKQGRALASNRDVMVATGMAPAMADQIATAAEAGDWSKADLLFRQEFVSTTKATDDEKTAAVARIMEAQKTQDVFRSSSERGADLLERAQTIEKAMAELARSRVFRDAEGWAVEDTDTNEVVRFDSREAAVEMAYSRLDDNAREEAIAMAKVLEAYSSGGDILELDLGKSMDLDQTGETEAAMKEAAITEAMLNGMSREKAEKIIWTVLGSNRLETVEGVRRVVAKLFQGAGVMDAIEEPIEGKFQAGLEQGVFTSDEALNFVRIAAEVMKAPELVTTAQSSARGLTEAVSDIVMADVFGQRKDGRKGVSGAVTAGLKAKLRRQAEIPMTNAKGEDLSKFATFLIAFRKLFKQVFKRSRALLKARKEGKLSGDFDEFLDTLMNVDPQRRHEAAAAKEALEIAQAGNMAFSLSRAVPADISNVTEMPDGAQLVGPTSFSLQAYHGTPHKVDKFTTAKIGTGEGAQAYGWGLYFAAAEVVASIYRRALSYKDTKRKFLNDLPEDAETEEVMDLIGTGAFSPYQERVLKALAADDWLGFDYPSQAISAAYSGKLQNWDPSQELVDAVEESGNLYTVELLPDEEDFLDWDKPLSEQSEKVKVILGPLISKFIINNDDFINSELKTQAVNGTMDGSKAYLLLGGEMSLAGDRSYPPQLASQSLAKLGIPGIRYLDGGSRDAGDGTRNYVIFDENLVRILEENGKPVSGASFSLTPKDTEYLAAVESDDMAKAQEMVDEAAKVAGYDRKLFHGTNATETVEGKSTSGSEEAIANLKALAKRVGLKDWNGITSVYQRLADNGQMGVTQKDAANAKKWQAEGTGTYEPSREKLAFDVFSPPSGELELGVHLGNESAAAMFGEVFPFFTKLGKPFRLPDLGTWNYQSVMREMRKRGVKISEAEYDFVFNANDNNAALRELLQSKGIESIVYRNEAEGEGDSFIAFNPSQIKSADPVTRDESGNVIPLSQRFNTESSDIRFSLAPRSLPEVADTILAAQMKKPAFFEAFVTLARRKMDKLRKDRIAFKKYTVEGADSLAQRSAEEIAQLDQKRKDRIAQVTDDLIAGGMDAKAAKSKATLEANEDFRKARQALPTEKEKQLMALRTLDAILSAFPPEIRAKVGGFVKLASFSTDAAREAEITRRLAKLEEVIEEEAKKHYAAKIGKMLDKAAPVGKPGEIKKSKFIVTVQDELDAISEMVGMDGDDVADSISKNEAAIISAQTPEAADAALTELNLLEIFGGVLDVKRTTSFELEVASEYLEELMKQGREARKMLDEARRERVKELVNIAKSEAFKGDAGPETTQAAKATAAKKSGKAMLKKFFNELSGFDGVLRDVFGADSKTAREFSERFTLNSNNYEDVQNERRKRLRDFARELYGTKLGAKINQKLIALERIENNSGVTYLKGREVKAHKLTLDDAAKIVADPKAFGFTAKDATAIKEEMDALVASKGRRNTFTYEQVTNDGDRTELPLSQMDALYISMALRQPGILEQQQRYGYDQETVDQLEKFLTDESKSWREWMQGEYDAEYQRANEVYMRMFNARMPKLMFYAPLLKNHQGQQAILDPLNTGISSNSANPSSIKSRKARTSSLRIDSALSVFWSHFNQMEYWISNAEYLRDVQSVMLNPEVRQSVVSAHGEDGMATVSAWVQLQMSRGVGKAALATAGSKMFRNVKSAVSMKALALNLSTTLKTLPSVFYSLGEIHLSKWPAALVSGMKHWDRLWKTNIIQRRLDIGGMPELRDLGNSALPMSWVNQGIRYGSYPTMYADGVFTTYSAAMAYGTSFDEAKRQGASDEVAHKYAEERTALIVSKTAQPENWTQKSLFENDLSGAGSLFFMFTSDPRQKMALTGEALNRWRKGSATTEEAMRKLLAYWIIPGIMFQLANAIGRSLFKGDDDEWEVVDFATAALAGQLQGLALIGSAAEMIFSAAIAAAAEKITGEEVKRKPFWNSPKNPLDGAANDLIKSVEKITEDDTKNGLGKAWEMAKSAGMLLSPLSPAGAIPSTAERVMKDTTNLFYGADEE